MTHFPALDPEPPPRSVGQVLRRLLLIVLAVAVVAGLGFGGWAVFGSTSTSGATPGELLVQQSDGALATATPTGSHQKPVVAGGFVGGAGGILVSADGDYLVSNQGALVARHDGTLGAASQALFSGMAEAGGDAFIDSGQPFADNDDYLAFSTEFDVKSGLSGIFLIRRTGGHPIPMGSGSDYVADPTRYGLYVVAGPPNGQQLVEYRTSATANRVIASQAQLLRDLGLPATAQAALSVTTDADGGKIAVEVQTATTGGIVVLSRSGAVLAHEPFAMAFGLSWSPSGDELVFSTRTGIELWPLAATPVAVSGLPETRADYCVWAPDGGHVVCATYPTKGGPISGWGLVDAKKASGRVYPAAGVALLWTQ